MSSTTRSKNTTPISQAESKSAAGRWSAEEHQRFVEALKLHGKNWKKVEEMVGTRDGTQIRSHAQKYFTKIEKEKKNEKRSAEKKDRFEPAESLRKSSESSISTHHTQQGTIVVSKGPNLSGQLENATEPDLRANQLKENLPLSEIKALESNNAKLTETQIKAKDVSTSNSNKLIEETKEEAKLPVQQTQNALLAATTESSDSQPVKSSVPLFSYETLLNSLFQLSQNTNLPYQQSASISPIPFLGLLPPNYCVYLNLRKYLVEHNKFNASLKLSDLVDLNNRKDQKMDDEEDAIYRTSNSSKKLKQL